MGELSAEASPLKKLVPFAKILVALGLIAFVLWLVPVRDQLTIPLRDGSTAKFVGTIKPNSPGGNPANGGAGNVDLVTSGGAIHIQNRADGEIDTIESTIPNAVWTPAMISQIPLVKGKAPTPQLAPGLVSVVKNASVPFLLLAFLMILLATFVAVYRWYLLLGAAELQTDLPRVCALTFIGAFFNNVMPGSQGGDIVKAYYIAREHAHRKTEAIITVLLDRVLGITGLTIVAGFVVPFDLERYREVGRWIYAILALELAFGVVFFSRRVRRVLGIEKLIAKLPFGDVFKKVDEAVFIYRFRRKTVFVSLALSLLVHTVLIVGIGFIGVGIGIDTPMLSYFAVVPVGLIVMALPIAPSGWGAGEAAFIFFWRTLGIHDALAVSLLLVYRVLQMIVSLVGGVYLAREKNRVSAQELEDFADADDPEDPAADGPKSN